MILLVSYDTSYNLNVKPIAQVIDLETGEKTDLKFEHQTVLTYIKIQNQTEGSLSNTGEYFKYKLSILGNVGDRFKMVGQDSFITFEGRQIRTEDFYEVKEGEDNFVYIYLKGNQKLTIGLLDGNIKQIPIGTKYKIQKVGARKWNTFINGEEVVETDYLIATENPEENQITIVNHRDFDVAITGIFINILPFILLIALGVIRNILYNKKQKDEDDNK